MAIFWQLASYFSVFFLWSKTSQLTDLAVHVHEGHHLFNLFHIVLLFLSSISWGTFRHSSFCYTLYRMRLIHLLFNSWLVYSSFYGTSVGDHRLLNSRFGSLIFVYLRLQGFQTFIIDRSYLLKLRAADSTSLLPFWGQHSYRGAKHFVQELSSLRLQFLKVSYIVQLDALFYCMWDKKIFANPPECQVCRC